MFWDNVACVYDVFANVINRKTNEELCSVVKNLILPEYEVLECACGTGLLTKETAQRCKSLVATDFSEKMLERAKKKCRKYANVHFEKADIMHLDYPDHSFDAVVAANVIHLLDEPYKALHELERVCRPGGKIIIPTYMNRTENGKINGASKAIEKPELTLRENSLRRHTEIFLLLRDMQKQAILYVKDGFLVRRC